MVLPQMLVSGGGVNINKCFELDTYRLHTTYDVDLTIILAKGDN